MTVRWGRDNVNTWLEQLNPETIVIMFGTNDLADLDVEEFEQLYRELVENCLDHGSVVVLTTIPPRHGQAEKTAEFAEIIREVSHDFHTPLVDYHAEVLARRPDDWDGTLPQFQAARESGGEYEVPTLISGDGVHPSNPRGFQDYSSESLNHNGFALRNYLTALRYAEVIETVLAPSDSSDE